MRYWLFDGNDVIGPLTPQCIAQRVGFSPSFLVCPEQESENERAWRPAASFEDFNRKADSVVSDKPVTSNTVRTSSNRQATSSANATNTHAARRIQPILTLSAEQTTSLHTVTRHAVSKQEPFAFSAIPISQVEKDEIILPLRSSLQETITAEKTQSNNEAKTNVAVAQKQTTVTSAQKRVPTQRTDETQISLRSPHSLPILGVSESRLPLLPEEDFHSAWENQPQEKPSYSTPSSIAVQRQEKRFKQWKVSSVALSAATGSIPLPNSVLTPLTGFSDTVEELVPTPRPVPVKQATPRVTVPVKQATPRVAAPVRQTVVPVTTPKMTIASAQRQVRAAQDPEEELPASLKKSSTRSTRNVLFGIFCTFLALVCLGVGYQIFPYFKWKGTPHAVAATTSQRVTSPTKKTSAKMQSIPTPPPPQAITVPLAQEEAVRIVKEYALPNGRGTVENYLNRLYSTHLTQGYQANWSAEPLYKSTYVVKYRLAKTRTEPIIYVFQADTVTGQLTGALNNITLDLVGKV